MLHIFTLVWPIYATYVLLIMTRKSSNEITKHVRMIHIIESMCPAMLLFPP
jgi:hypothetical protein